MVGCFEVGAAFPGGSLSFCYREVSSCFRDISISFSCYYVYHCILVTGVLATSTDIRFNVCSIKASCYDPTLQLEYVLPTTQTTSDIPCFLLFKTTQLKHYSDPAGLGVRHRTYQSCLPCLVKRHKSCLPYPLGCSLE